MYDITLAGLSNCIFFLEKNSTVRQVTSNITSPERVLLGLENEKESVNFKCPYLIVFENLIIVC